MWGKRESQTANDEDFSLALEMTKRASDVSQSLSHLTLLISSHSSLLSNKISFILIDFHVF